MAIKKLGQPIMQAWSEISYCYIKTFGYHDTPSERLITRMSRCLDMPNAIKTRPFTEKKQIHLYTNSPPSLAASLSTLQSRRRPRRKITASPTAASTASRNRRVAPRRLQHLCHILAQLRHGRGHLLGEHVAKGRKGALLAAHELVPAAHELDELARVNVRVAAVFDVLEQFGGHGGEEVRRGGGNVDVLERGGERFAVEFFLRIS